MIVLTTPSEVTSSVISGSSHMAQITSSARARSCVRTSSGVVIRSDWPNFVAPKLDGPRTLMTVPGPR